MAIAICTTVENDATGHSTGVSRFAQVSTANDNLFDDKKPSRNPCVA